MADTTNKHKHALLSHERNLSSTLPLKLRQNQGLADPQADPFHRIPEAEHGKIANESLGSPLFAQHLARGLLLEKVEHFPAIVR